MKTKNNIDTPFGDAERNCSDQAKEWLAKEEIVSIDVQVGDGTRGHHRPADRPAGIRPSGLRRAEALQARRHRPIRPTRC